MSVYGYVFTQLFYQDQIFKWRKAGLKSQFPFHKLVAQLRLKNPVLRIICT